MPGGRVTGVVWEAVGVVRQWESVRIVANLQKNKKTKTDDT